MDRWVGRELELRRIVRDLNDLDLKAQRLEQQTRQLKLDEIAKLDARDWLVPATQAKKTAEALRKWVAKLDQDVKSSSKGALGRHSQPSAVPGLVGTAKDKATRLSRTITALDKDLERLQRTVTDKMNDPLRQGRAAMVGGASTQLVFSGLQTLFQAVLGLVG